MAMFKQDVEKGTTSACAENTGCLQTLRSRVRNYLRVRGEYILIGCHPPQPLELPPRARRIQRSLDGLIANNGTTSACAENTHCHTRATIR